MDGIGANSVNNVGKVDGYKPQQKAEKQASEYTPKTGDLTQYLENLGNNQRVLINPAVSPEKLKRQLKGDKKFLEKNCPDIEVTPTTVKKFRTAVNNVPLPKDYSVLDEKSLENYKRTQALKQFNN